MAAKLPHTWNVVEKILVVSTVKVGRDLLFRNQHANVGLCTVYDGILQVHVFADLLQ